MAELRLDKLNKIYDNGFHAVHDFSLEIKDGEFIVFVGPSGCGKSTTLRMIAGLEDISKGTLYINGKEVNDKSPRDRGIAMVFQSYALYPHLTVYDNMSFGLMLEGFDGDVIEKRVHETARILGLEEYLDRFPRALSGGQRQRVALGRAIIRHVDVFLMDEPLSNLDAKQRVTMRTEIIGIHRKVGATTVYVTHDQTEAMTMADRIVVMRDGYIQQVGTPFELYFHPVNKFVAGFIGEPPMNFVDVDIKGGEAKLAFDTQTVDLKKQFPSAISEYEGKRITVGFRPEAISLVGESERSEDAITLSGEVEVTELLGDNVNIYANLGEHKVILKVSPYEEPKMKQKIYFKVPYKSIYLFESDSEKNIEGK